MIFNKSSHLKFLEKLAIYKAIGWPNLGTHSWQFKTCLKEKQALELTYKVFVLIYQG